MENWRGYLKEVEFYDQQPDYDKIPGAGKAVVVFDPEDDYSREGATHGGMSHSIKHYMEFNPSAVQQAVTQVAAAVLKTDNVFIKKAGAPSVMARDDEAKQVINQNPNILLNTFDLINDKVLNGESLNDTEQKLLPIIKKIYSEYKNLAEEQLSKSSDVDNVGEAKQVLDLLEGGKVIRFTATYGESEKIYALNPQDTSIVSFMQGKMSTFFKIDKSGKNKQKVLRYFTKGMKIKNSVVLDAVQEWVGAAEKQPQQQQKKQKPQQQKKGPNIKAMALDLANRGGKSLEDIQAQIKKTTGRDISADNIKRMIGI